MKVLSLLALGACAVSDPLDPETGSDVSELVTQPQAAVTVVNDAAHPVPVVLPPAPRREPFQFSGMSFMLTAQGTLTYGDNRYAVPTGKRVTIERVSASCNAPPGSRPSLTVVATPPAGSGEEFARVFLPLQPPVDDGGYVVFNHELRLVASGGGTVSLTRGPIASGATFYCLVTLTGELTDL